MDRTDFVILANLQKNARLSNKELAARVGLAPSSCLERVRRLLASGVLRGFHADIDPLALGIGLEALIALRLSRHSRASIESFMQHVRALPELIAVYHLAGADDFLIHVGVRDAHHLRDLALDSFSERPEVAHMETSLIFSSERKPHLPLANAAESRPRRRPGSSEPEPEPEPERRRKKTGQRARTKPGSR